MSVVSITSRLAIQGRYMGKYSILLTHACGRATLLQAVLAVLSNILTQVTVTKLFKVCTHCVSTCFFHPHVWVRIKRKLKLLSLIDKHFVVYCHHNNLGKCE